MQMNFRTNYLTRPTPATGSFGSNLSGLNANIQNKYLNPQNNSFSRSRSNSYLPNSPHYNTSSRINQRFNPASTNSRLNYNDSLNYEDESAINLNALIDEGEVFPQDILLLITEESKNIRNFKSRIEKEKTRVVNDFELFKKEINHVIDDLKISMMAELDQVYKTYIEKYTYLKNEVLEVRRLKKQIRANNPNLSLNTINPHDKSNMEMVREIEEQVNSLRNYKITNYVNQIQRKKLYPLQELTKDVIIMTSTPLDYYDANCTNVQLGELKQNFSHFTKHMFAALRDFVKSPESILNSAKVGTGEQILDGLDSKVTANNNFPKTIDTVVPPQNYIPNASPRARKPFGISQSQQILTCPQIQDIGIRHMRTARPEHSDIILCAIVVNREFLVTGSKDSSLTVMTLEGDRIGTLRGHEASVCTLATINDNGTEYLVSGSDHGCSSIIIWDPVTWAIRAKIKAHASAVTSILDLGDGQTLVSGSYDKKINVYNFRRSALLYDLPNNKSSVTSMVLNKTKSKMISCGFDGNILVWNINRQAGVVVDNISLDKIIKNNAVVCSLNSSVLRNDLVIAGCKDGKVKLWNLNTGECEKTISACSSLVIEMVVLERESKPNHPIIVCCGAKERSLAVVKTDTNAVSRIDLADKNFIEFGCGISPKIVFARYGGAPAVAVVNQSTERKEVNIFQLELR